MPKVMTTMRRGKGPPATQGSEASNVTAAFFCTLFAAAALSWHAQAVAATTQSPSTQPDSSPQSQPSASAAAVVTAAEMQELAEYLIHTARDYGHEQGRAAPRKATLHVLALMKAAAELDPTNADARLWQFDLFGRMGFDADARQALRDYIRLAPDDESARLQDLSLTLETLQNAEARAAYLVEQLKRADLPDSLRSDIHRRLAEYFHERNDRDQAARQIERALRYMPLNLPARQLAYEVFSQSEPLLQRVELALQLLRINPSQTQTLWDLAKLLDEHALHRQAQEWYQRALDVHNRATSEPPPPEFWMDRAASYLGARQYGDAFRAIQTALERHPELARGYLWKAYIAQQAAEADVPGMAEAAKVALEEVAPRYDAAYEKAVAAKDANAAAEIAWYFAYVRGNSAQALQITDIAMTARRPSVATRRARAFALLLVGRVQEAQALLEPIADTDQMAALGLGRALLSQDRRNDAIKVLTSAARRRYSGIAYDQIRDLLRTLAVAAPRPPSEPRVEQALQAFDRRLFDFHVHPGDTLQLTLLLAEDPPPPCGPIRLRVRLTHLGKPDSFAVTLGDGLMVRPRVLISAELDGRANAAFAAVTEVLLNRKPILAPGESVEVSVTADVGPLREELLRSAGRARTISFSGLLDPIRTTTGYTAGLASVYSLPLRIERPALPSDAEGVAQMVAATKAADPFERIDAAQAIGALLAGDDRVIRPSDRSRALYESGARGALVEMAQSDPNWVVSCFAIDALSWGAPNPARLNAALSQRLTDPQPVVRLMTARLLNEVQPAELARTTAEMAAHDPSQSVRLLALSYEQAPGYSEAEAPIPRPKPQEQPKVTRWNKEELEKASRQKKPFFGGGPSK